MNGTAPATPRSVAGSPIRHALITVPRTIEMAAGRKSRPNTDVDSAPTDHPDHVGDNQQTGTVLP
jgi:hypothetical protein